MSYRGYYTTERNEMGRIKINKPFLRMIMFRSGKPPQKIAKEVDMSVEYLQSLASEKNKVNSVSDNKVYKIAEAVGCSADKLIDPEEFEVVGLDNKVNLKEELSNSAVEQSCLFNEEPTKEERSSENVNNQNDCKVMPINANEYDLSYFSAVVDTAKTKKLLQKKKLTAQTLASITGVSITTCNPFFKGEPCRKRLDVINKIAQVLNVVPEDIYDVKTIKMLTADKDVAKLHPISWNALNKALSQNGLGEEDLARLTYIPKDKMNFILKNNKACFKDLQTIAYKLGVNTRYLLGKIPMYESYKIVAMLQYETIVKAEDEENAKDTAYENIASAIEPFASKAQWQVKEITREVIEGNHAGDL